MRLVLGHGRARYQLVAREDAATFDLLGASALDPEEALWEVGGLLRAGGPDAAPGDVARLRAYADRLLPLGPRSHADDVQWIRRALADGRLVLIAANADAAAAIPVLNRTQRERRAAEERLRAEQAARDAAALRALSAATAAAARDGAPPPAPRPAPPPPVYVHTLDIVAIDEAGQPVGDLAWLVVDGQGRTHRGRLPGHGRLHVADLPPGEAVFSFTALDQHAWRPDAGTTAPTRGTLPQSGTARRHAVRAGESLERIAAAAARGAAALWDDDANRELRERRGHPGMLAPGDALALPIAERKEVAVAVDASHRFVVSGMRVRIAVRVFDGERPRAGEDWRIVDGEREVAKGRTDPGGLVEAWVPVHLTAAELVIGPLQRRLRLDLGAAAAIDQPGAAQARLRDLGLRCAGAPGLDDADGRADLRCFHRRCGHQPAETLDDAARQRIAQAHRAEAPFRPGGRP